VIYLKHFEKQGLSAFLDEWKMVDGLKNCQVTLRSTHLEAEGQVKGINEQGHLLLKLKNGTLQAYSSGDTEKVRKK
jgi:biotin-(acetyl-CoA carboxylase) ligase